jgi:DNA-binding GntR family transcriptional regulator
VSGSSALYEAYERLLVLPFASPSALLRASFGNRWLSLRFQQGLSQHRAIVLAIRASDANQAERLARAHVRLTQRLLETDFESDRTIVRRLPGRNLVSFGELQE